MRFVIDPDCFSSSNLSPTELLLEMLVLVDSLNSDYEERKKELLIDKKIKIFISYKRQINELANRNLILARQIGERLKRAGFDPFLDETAGILPGAEWEDYIEREITRSRLFLALLSPFAVTDEGYHRIEHDKALYLHRRREGAFPFIIPIMTEGTILPPYFHARRIQSLNFADDWVGYVQRFITEEKKWQCQRLDAEKADERPGVWVDKHLDGSRLTERYRNQNEIFASWQIIFSDHNVFHLNRPAPIDIDCPNNCAEHGKILYGVVSAIGGKLVSEEACRHIHSQRGCPFVEYLNNVLNPGRDNVLLPSNIIPFIQALTASIQNKRKERNNNG